MAVHNVLHVEQQESWIDNEVSLKDLCQMECGCCFGDTNVEDMVQCSDGHLFCVECLGNYAKEAIHGQGKPRLLCMTEGCDAPFPRNQMEKAMSGELIAKLDERVQEESLNLANITNLFRCPGCHYGAEMTDDSMQVFVCPQCSKCTCRHCKEDWSNHEGLTCDQVEKDDETSIRIKYEEQMTETLVRRCPKCSAPLVKEEGCNKVTCRCGCTICYLCRKRDVDYSHFCPHSRPGQRRACELCPLPCLLWTNPKEDDERHIQELKKKGTQEKRERGILNEKIIGAPDTSKHGKRKAVSQPRRYPRQPDPPATNKPSFPHIRPRLNTIYDMATNRWQYHPAALTCQQLSAPTARLTYPNALAERALTLARNISQPYRIAALTPSAINHSHLANANSSANVTTAPSTSYTPQQMLQNLPSFPTYETIKGRMPTSSTQLAGISTPQPPSYLTNGPSTSSDQTPAKMMKVSCTRGEPVELNDGNGPLARKEHKISGAKEVSSDRLQQLVELWDEERKFLEDLEAERRTQVTELERKMDRRRTDLINVYNERRRQLLKRSR